MAKKVDREADLRPLSYPKGTGRLAVSRDDDKLTSLRGAANDLLNMIGPGYWKYDCVKALDQALRKLGWRKEKKVEANRHEH
jgi:hypothetical protein